MLPLFLCVAGRNLLFAYYQFIIGNKNWMSPIDSKVHEIDSMVELRDIVHVMNRRVGLIKWLMEYRKGDMNPYYAKRNKMIKNFIYKIV